MDRRTVVLDLDGTLIDVSKRHYAVYRDVLAELGGEALPFERYWELKRSSTPWPELLGNGHVAPFLAAFRARIEQPRYLGLDSAFPFTHDVIEALAEHELHLVTLRQSRGALTDQLNRLDLVRQFKTITSDRHATKVDLIRSIARGQETIVVGDTESDVMAARELHASAVAVTSGLRSEAILRRSEPDVLIEDISSLPDIVASMR
jgi:phosphoglycolate phosphatase-like HAD superfamily hydrolase